MKIHLTRLFILLFCLTAIVNNAYSQLQSLCISGYIDDHAYVDLGLPSGKKWATENLCNKDTGRDEFDAAERLAHHFWSSAYDKGFYRQGWNEPSKEDFEELIEKCTWEWTSYKNTEGVKGTGPNGNYIFFPANFHVNVNTYGYYWSRTHSPRFGIEFYAMMFYNNGGKPYLTLQKGDKKFNVRPVF